MIIYGVGILAFCFIVGQLIGEFLGHLWGINANIGGVGFAMVLLMLVCDWLSKKGLLDKNIDTGISFWNQMYLPIIVAMAATQNVKLALTSGVVALMAGIIPVLLCFFLIPFLAKHRQ